MVEKPPAAVIAPLACLLARPLLVMASAPVVVKLFCRSNVVPRSVAEPTATVEENVVAPVAADVCERAPLMAIWPLKLVAPALVTVTFTSPVASAVPPDPNPKRPATFTEPAPALSVRLSEAPPAVPLVAPLSEIAPPPLVSVTFAPCVKVNAPPIVKAALLVVMFLASDTSFEAEKPPAALTA